MKKHNKTVFLISLLILAVLVFFIAKPFLDAVFFGAVIAYLFRPLFVILNRRLKNKSISAVLMLVLVILLLTVPMFFLFNLVSKEVKIIYSSSRDSIINGNILLESCNMPDSLVCRVNDKLRKVMEIPYVENNIMDSISSIFSSIFSSFSNIILSVPLIIINLIIFIFVLFYMLRDWDEIMGAAEKLLPFSSELKKALKKNTKEVIYAAIYGTLIVALIQGAIGTAAFIIFDSTKAPFFWGAVMVLAALLPFIGTALVWLPISIKQILIGYSQGAPDIVWKGIGMLLVGACVISLIDNLIKPKIIGDRASIHPLLVFFGVFGGMMLFGFVGIFVGPIIISFLLAFLRVYVREKDEIMR